MLERADNAHEGTGANTTPVAHDAPASWLPWPLGPLGARWRCVSALEWRWARARRQCAPHVTARNGALLLLLVKLGVFVALWPLLWPAARCNLATLEAPLWDTRYLDWTETDAFSVSDETELREFLAWREPERGVSGASASAHKLGIGAARAENPLVLTHATRDSVDVAVHWACRAHAAALVPRVLALDGAATCAAIRAQAEWLPCLALQTRGFLHPVYAQHYVAPTSGPVPVLVPVPVPASNNTSAPAHVSPTPLGAPPNDLVDTSGTMYYTVPVSIDVIVPADGGRPAYNGATEHAGARAHAALVQRARAAWRILALGHDVVLSDPDVIFAANASFRFHDYISAHADVQTLEGTAAGVRGRVLRAAIDLFGYTNPNFGLVYARSNVRTIAFFQLLHMQQATELRTQEHAYTVCGRAPWRRIGLAHFRRDLFVDGLAWRTSTRSASRMPVAVHLSALLPGPGDRASQVESKLELLGRWGLYAANCRAATLPYVVPAAAPHGPRLFETD